MKKKFLKTKPVSRRKPVYKQAGGRIDGRVRHAMVQFFRNLLGRFLFSRSVSVYRPPGLSPAEAEIGASKTAGHSSSIIKFQKAAGFTLLELLIILSIIALFSSIAILNSSNQNDRVRLRLTYQEIVNTLRSVQNYSISTKMNNSNVPLGGYGIRFVSKASPSYDDSYSIFADNNNDRNYEADEQLDKKILFANLEVCRITVFDSGSTNEVNELNVVFLPPDPKTYLNGLNGAADYATVFLRVKGRDCSSGRTVTVKTSGVIE